MWRDDVRQNPSNLASVHLGLNLFALSRTGSLSHTRSNGVLNLRPFLRLNGVSPSAPTMQAQITSSGVVCHPRCQTRASIGGLPARFSSTTAFVVLTRPPTVKVALSAIPFARRVTWRTDLVHSGCSLRTKLSNTTDEFTDTWLSVCSDSDLLAIPTHQSISQANVQHAGHHVLSSKRLQQTSCRCVCPSQLTVVLSLR